MIFIFIYLFTRNYFNKSILNPEMVGSFKTLRRYVVTKVDQSAIFASFGGGRGWERVKAEASPRLYYRESAKVCLFLFDIMPKSLDTENKSQNNPRY